MNKLVNIEAEVKAFFAAQPALVLPVKREYFEQMRDGTKLFEYRIYNRYWRQRLEHRAYSNVIITLGYPKRDDAARRLVFPWRGWRIETITHPHFGAEPVKVFAIVLGEST